jgi:hypothetical protein
MFTYSEPSRRSLIKTVKAAIEEPLRPGAAYDTVVSSVRHDISMYVM